MSRFEPEDPSGGEEVVASAPPDGGGIGAAAASGTSSFSGSSGGAGGLDTARGRSIKSYLLSPIVDESVSLSVGQSGLCRGQSLGMECAIFCDRSSDLRDILIDTSSS